MRRVLAALLLVGAIGGCDRGQRDRLPADLSAAEGRPLNESLADDADVINQAVPPAVAAPAPLPDTMIETLPGEPVVPALRRPASPPVALDRAGPDVADGASPSFNCGDATSDGEHWVCDDPDLAALDRRMAQRFARVRAGADPATRERLRDSGRRFIAARNRCGDPDCVADVYHQRIAEIDALSNR